MSEFNVNINWSESGIVDIHSWTCENGHENGPDSLESHGCGKRSRELIVCETCGATYEGNWVGMEYSKVKE